MSYGEEIMENRGEMCAATLTFVGLNLQCDLD